MLWVVSYLLIDKHGFSDSLFPPQPSANGTYTYPNDFYEPPVIHAPIPKHGNTLAIQLVITGMKFQPCLPTFFAARDAILLADQALTGGKNQCEIWAGFASRGLGQDAHSHDNGSPMGPIRTNGYKLDPSCPQPKRASP